MAEMFVIANPRITRGSKSSLTRDFSPDRRWSHQSRLSMQQTHFKLRKLNGARKPDSEVQALFATQPEHKAILFIHGFSGNPITTWSRFHEMLPAKATGADLLFYGYDGLRADMVASAGIFRGFLERLFSEASVLANDCLPQGIRRAPDFEYRKLTIVAHSLGVSAVG